MTSALVAWFAMLASLGAPPGPAESATLNGKVIELTDALKSRGLVTDAEPIARQVVLQAEDGTITPLLSDDGSRALFLDARLRNRAAELKTRRLPGLPYVQVVTFRVLEEGKMQVPEYYCEICTISVRSPQICPCCQGPMVLRMRPESR